MIMPAILLLAFSILIVVVATIRFDRFKRVADIGVQHAVSQKMQGLVLTLLRPFNAVFVFLCSKVPLRDSCSKNWY